MGSFGVVTVYPCVQTSLELLQRLIQLSPEGNLIKLIQNRFVEPLTDAICLRMTRLDFCVLNTVHAEIKQTLKPVLPSPVNRPRGGFFSSLMKFIPSPGFPGLKKPELETGTKISLFYNNNPGIPVVPVFLNDF